MKKANSNGVANNYPGRQTTPKYEDLRRLKQDYKLHYCEDCGKPINKHNTRQLVECEIQTK